MGKKKEVLENIVAPSILAVVIIALIILVATKTATIENVLLAGMVGITAWYAYSTIKISKATKKQANASVEMAKEMREQRYSESLPLLVPTIPPDWNTEGLAPKEVPYVYLQSGIGIKVVWRNLGKGVAINSRFSFWTAPTSPGKAHFFPPRESEVLGIQEEKMVDYHKMGGGQLCDIPEAYHPQLEAEYQDIYERKITTVQQFRIDEQNENKRAFLGELYFTINGRRLGKETTQP